MLGGTATRRWMALNEIFCAAHPLRGDARERLIAERCAEDPALATEVRALLRAADTLGPLDALASRLAPVPELLADPVPERVGPYVVTGELGRGGMGIVYRAHDPRLRRDVALKFYPRALRNDDSVRARFVAEARAASALDHPHLCTIYDVGALPDGRMYLAMSYCPRGTLADRLAAGPLPVEEAVRIAAEIADGLAGAHAAGIIHRDVKPRNVAFGERDEARLLDFGVALLADGATLDGADTAGTPAYMAPEQVRGGAIDARADLWALGVVLFEMLTGRRPFEGESRNDVLRRILLDAAPDLAKAAPQVPSAVVRVVRRALRKDPDDRWSSAIEMKAALERAVAPSTRRAGWLPATAAVVLVVGAAAALSMRPFVPREPTPPSPGAVSLARARERLARPNRQDTEVAIALLHDALARDPKLAAARAYLARAYVAATRPGMSRQSQRHWLDSSIVEARAAVTLAPRLADAHAALAHAHVGLGAKDSALAHYRVALGLDPRHATSAFELAKLHRSAGRLAETAAWLERAVALDAQLPDVHRFAAMFYRVLELPAEARRHLSAGLRATPGYERLLWEGIQLELLARDTAAARRHLDTMLPLLDHAEQDRLAAWFEATKGDMAAARPFVDRVAPTARTSWDLWTYGFVYRGTGERAKGDSLLRRAVAVLNTDLKVPSAEVSYRLGLARVHAALGEREASLRVLEEWAERGGQGSWANLDREPEWGAVRDDPRFQAVVDRTRAIFRADRERVARELARMRAAGALRE